MGSSEETSGAGQRIYQGFGVQICLWAIVEGISSNTEVWRPTGLGVWRCFSIKRDSVLMWRDLLRFTCSVPYFSDQMSGQHHDHSGTTGRRAERTLGRPLATRCTGGRRGAHRNQVPGHSWTHGGLAGHGAWIACVDMFNGAQSS